MQDGVRPTRGFGFRLPCATTIKPSSTGSSRISANRTGRAARHFLTREEFNDRYAPTRRTGRASRAGAPARRTSRSYKRYPNRTIVDATAKSSVVEHFFSTEIHTVRQGKYGERYTNVKPATVPPEIAPLVRDVSLNNLSSSDRRRSERRAAQRTAPQFPHDAQGRAILPLAAELHRTDSSGNLVNGNFASGSLSPGWINESTHAETTCKSRPRKRIRARTRRSWGRLQPPEINGWGSIAQLVKVPSNGVLSFWVYQGSNEGQLGYGTKYAWQAGYLLNQSGSILDTFYKTVNNTNGWVNYQVNLERVRRTDRLHLLRLLRRRLQPDVRLPIRRRRCVGRRVALAVAVADRRRRRRRRPRRQRRSRPRIRPHSDAVIDADLEPDCRHPRRRQRRAADATTRRPITDRLPTRPERLRPASPNRSTSRFSMDATAPDIPRRSRSTIRSTRAISPSTYRRAGVTQTGTVTNEAVDGGGSGDDAETDLDVQTISGLAPGANIIVYDMGSLGDQQIEDTYNQVLSDGKATAVNSSFGGCESSDVSFADSTNSIAEQGASEGVEFSASSGDSGSNECSGTKGVSAPAGDPYFSSIGGIDFTDTSQGVLETVTMGSVDGDSGGGGVSTVFALPSYQSGITGMITSGRNQPDISLPFFPVAVYTGGSWGEYLGTSWSSPASVALIIEANELHSSKLGWVDPTIYSLFASTGYSTYYTPCTSGNNGAYSCNASQYNQAAGIGAPKGWALANAL